MLIGYARVSTTEQNLDLQHDALRKAGCKRIFSDKASGVKAERPGLNDLLAHLREGDEVLVWKLDRLGRKPLLVLNLIEAIETRGAFFRSVTQPEFSTNGAHGRFMLQIFAGVAELERSMIAERCAAGRETAKARGTRFGRPPSLTKAQVARIREDVRAERISQGEAARLFRVSQSTISRLMKEDA